MEPLEHYYVLVEGMRGSEHRHKSLASAYTEARRLAEIAKDRRVFVLQTIGAIQATSPQPQQAKLSAAALSVG